MCRYFYRIFQPNYPPPRFFQRSLEPHYFDVTSRRGRPMAADLSTFITEVNIRFDLLSHSGLSPRLLISIMDFQQKFGNNFSILPGWRPVSKSIEIIKQSRIYVRYEFVKIGIIKLISHNRDI